MSNVTIAIDAMGGDHGPPVVVPAGLQVLARYPLLHLILVGDSELLEKELAKFPNRTERLTIQHASECVEMNESPAHALRTKKNSSMRIAINLVKEGKASACVSAGNTGALMATAHFVLKTLPGIDRAAIISSFPTKKGRDVRILDLGANVDSVPNNLFQFAVMGSVMASAIDTIPTPQVYLLNIGHEDNKGNELVKQTDRLLTHSKAVHYAGYIEADKIYDGDADVVVCDGFVGNVTLKTTEGVAILISQLLKDAFYRNGWTKLAALISLPVLKSLIKRMDPDRYNGAIFIGLKGVVVKSHGGAKTSAFACAIEKAIVQAEKNIPQKISAEVERLLKLSAHDS